MLFNKKIIHCFVHNLKSNANAKSIENNFNSTNLSDFTKITWPVTCFHQSNYSFTASTLFQSAAAYYC